MRDTSPLRVSQIALCSAASRTRPEQAAPLRSPLAMPHHTFSVWLCRPRRLLTPLQESRGSVLYHFGLQLHAPSRAVFRGERLSNSPRIPASFSYAVCLIVTGRLSSLMYPNNSRRFERTYMPLVHHHRRVFPMECSAGTVGRSQKRNIAESVEVSFPNTRISSFLRLSQL